MKNTQFMSAMHVYIILHGKKHYQQRTKKFGLFEATALKDRTKEIFNELNKEFRNHNTSLAKQAKEYLKTQKPSSIVRLAKKNIEDQFQETCVER